MGMTTLAVAMLLAGALAASGPVRAEEPRKAPDRKEQAKAGEAKPADKTADKAPAGRAEAARPQPGDIAAAARANAAKSHLADLPRKVDPKTGREVIVITNRELERYYPPLPQDTKPVAQLPAVPPKPGGQPAEKPPGQAAQQQRIEQLEAEIARLRQKMMSLHNPYLPRAKETDEERQAEQGLDNRQRLEMTRKRLAELEAELARARGGTSGAGGGDRR